jgi:hypothetical protein
MKNAITKAVTAGAVTYTVLSVVYGDAQYAAYGPVQVATEDIFKVVPVLASILYPLIASQWPRAARWVGLIRDAFKYQPPEKARIMRNVGEIEGMVDPGSDIAIYCQEIREELTNA